MSPKEKNKGGRPKGSKSPETLEKERVLAAMRQRIMRKADYLLDSQFSLAMGQQFLFRIDKTKIVGPKGGVSYRNEKPVLVTSDAEIRSYLEGLLADGDIADDKDPGAAYYFITTKEPDGRALDSMFDRAFGRPTQHVEATGKDGEPIVVQWQQ